MLVADANVVVRYIVRDDVDQSARARAVIDGNAIRLLTTVLIEVEWVLRRALRQPRADVLRALKAFASMPNVALEDSDRVHQALTWAVDGMDFADAVHLAGAKDTEGLLTFDKAFAALAMRLQPLPVREP